MFGAAVSLRHKRTRHKRFRAEDQTGDQSTSPPRFLHILCVWHLRYGKRYFTVHREEKTHTHRESIWWFPLSYLIDDCRNFPGSKSTQSNAKRMKIYSKNRLASPWKFGVRDSWVDQPSLAFVNGVSLNGASNTICMLYVVVFHSGLSFISFFSANFWQWRKSKEKKKSSIINNLQQKPVWSPFMFELRP